ncbi:MAG: hypothetical protein J6T43_09180 [Prevotella sp.]|nr:hypothetical protein [Prevotella sp.]
MKSRIMAVQTSGSTTETRETNIIDNEKSTSLTSSHAYIAVDDKCMLLSEERML